MWNSLTSRRAPPNPIPRPVPVAQGRLDVGDAGAVVLESEPQPVAAAAVEQLHAEVPAAAIDVGVARELAGRRHDFRLVDDREPEFDGGVAYHLADAHDVI